MSWKVISFYTLDYSDEVAILIESLEKFKIPYDIEAVKNKGAWKENAFYKIPFIIKKLKQYNHPLVWLDADAKVVQYPEEFNNLGDTLMAGIHSPINKPIPGVHIHTLNEYVSNTIYLTPTKEVHTYLKEVHKFVKQAPNIYNAKMVGEQFYMQKVLDANNWMVRLKYRDLPYSYGLPSYWGKKSRGDAWAKIFAFYTKAPVIVQRQASRRRCPEKVELYTKLGLSLTD